MSMTIVAAHLTTESGDDYLYLFDQVEDPEELVELIEQCLGEELEYVSEIDIQVLYSKYDEDEYRRALREHIDSMGDY